MFLLKIMQFSRRKMSSLSLSLLRDKAYIAGGWVPAKNNDSFEVFNPANGQVIGLVADCGAEETKIAIGIAHKAFQLWQDVTGKERSFLLKRWFNLIIENKEELAKILTLEQGKPLREAEGEVVYGASFIEWFAEEARRIYGEIIPSAAGNKKLLVFKQPIGVVGLITPWNFPNAMITRKIGAALAAGCTCVLKPSEDTPFSALALCELAEKAGIPPGVINVLPASRNNSPIVGKVLCDSPLVHALSFTGSTNVGKLLLQQCASTVKKVSLELGGNAPFIVFDSADIDAAVNAAVVCKFRCSGQTCVCANRILVQDGVHDIFVRKMADAMDQQLFLGDGMHSKTTLGPLINAKAVEKVEYHIGDAIKNGAKLLKGGKCYPAGTNYFEATLLTNVTTDMVVCKEETFGPVAPILRFKTEQEALAIANSVNVGLAGYFFSRDIAQIFRVAQKLQVGMVGVNEGIMSTCEAPFGGVKESGIGREGSHHGIEEFIEIKYVCLGGM